MKPRTLTPERAYENARRDLHLAALKLGAVANVRGKRSPKLPEFEADHENAARAFVSAEQDLVLSQHATEQGLEP